MSNKVFVSYRRVDCAGEAGRLTDGLEELLDGPCVFRDVDDIAAGADFEATLRQQLADTDAVLVLMGKRWLPELAARQARPEPDYVRLEVATALSLGKRVIPVLLQGAEMPAAANLPPDLQTLAKRHAISLREEAWKPDMARLADAVGRPFAWRPLLLRALVALPLAVVLAKLGVERMAAESESQLALARAVVLGILLCYAGGEWLWWRRHRRPPG